MAPLACWSRTSINIHRYLFIKLSLYSPNIRHLTDINQETNFNLQIQEWPNLSTVSRYWVLRCYGHSAIHLYFNYDVSKKHYTATSGRMIISWQFTNDFQGTRRGPISDSFLANMKWEKQRKFCRMPGTQTEALHTLRGIRFGECYLTTSHKEKASPPDTAPQNMRHLLSLCGNDVIRSTASSPAVKDSPMICLFNPMIGYVAKLLTDTFVDFASSPPSRNRYHTG